MASPRSVYVHVPFCRKACHYCAFHFSTTRSSQTRVLKAMVRELELRLTDRGSGHRWPLETLYLGGGTPSLLEPEALTYLVNGLLEKFDVSTLQEFTLEANPEDVYPKNLELWKRLGVNRISLGVQSVDDRFLEGMNRAHDSQQSHEAMRLLADDWSGPWTADLIYAYPDQDPESLKKDLETILSYQPGHFSAYQLTQEPRTVLHTRVQRGEVHMPDDDRALELMQLLFQWAETQGYRAYEISNFARTGCEAVHNSRYWSGQAYLGLGPSAHSFDGEETRSWNINHNLHYCRGIEAGSPEETVEVLTMVDRLNEFLMIRLRLDAGLPWDELTSRFGANAKDRVRERLLTLSPSWFREEGFLGEEQPLRLSHSGRGLADYIASSLFDDGPGQPLNTSG